MKNLFACLSVLLLALPAAAEIDRFYQPEFEIVSTEPMCPAERPAGTVCLGFGVVVNLKATLAGCLDELKFYRVQTERTPSFELRLHVASLAVHPAANNGVRCVAPPVVHRTVTLPLASHREIILENQPLSL